MSRLGRLSTALAVGLLAALAPALPAWAEEFTVTPGVQSVVNGPMGSPPIDLDYDLYVPAGASAGDPRPAIVLTHGFGLSKSAPEVTSMSSFLARNGYLVLAYTAAGFGASGGCVTLQSADYDARGTGQLVDAVLEPRTDVLRDAGGLVLGTVGGSYGGGGQLPYAAQDERVRAAAPGRTWNLLQYSLNPNNRVVPGDPTGFSHELNEQGVSKLAWTSLFFALGNAQPVQGNGGCPEYKLATSDPAVAGTPCLGYLAALCQVYAGVVATGDTSAQDRALLGRASAATFLDELVARRLPVLLVQGQRDTLFNPNDALATYTRLHAAGVPATMIWNWGGHGGYDSLPGECEVYGGGTGFPTPSVTGEGLADCYLSGRTLDFFDAHLRGTGDPGPGFSWHREWVPFADGADGTAAADEQYGTAAAYPAMPSVTFTLSGGDALVPPGGTVTPGSVTFLNPAGGVPASYSETSNFSGPSSDPQLGGPPTDQPGQTVSFTTPPLAADTESVGVPTATVQLAHTSPGDLFLFAKTYDVAPEGTAELIHRMVAPVRVPADAVGEPVEVALIGFAHRFAAGHSARLVLTATDAAYRNSPVPDVVTLTTGPGSTFSLPLPAGTVVAPAVAPTEPGSAAAAPPRRAAPLPRLPATGPAAALPVLAVLVLAGAAVLRRRAR